ncbi:MAG: ABC transporter permease subunit, partial [Nocardiopsis sp. BM-2018]
MSLTETGTPAVPEHVPLRMKQGNAKRRQRTDQVLRAVLTFLMALASVPLVLIMYQVIQRGAGVISWEFLTAREFPPSREGGGYAAGFVGTGIMVTWAAVMAVPTGILAAVYVVEVGRGWLAGLIRFFTDVMTGIPSVFVGLAIYFLIIANTGFTFGAFPGALALGVIMLPIVVRSSEEILRTVPDELRQGSLA